MSHHTSDTKPARIGFNLKALARLVWRTWPYLRPQLFHLIVWISLPFLTQVLFVSASMVAFDLLYSRIIAGEKLEPPQARLLWLDGSYVGEVSTPEEEDDNEIADESASGIVTDELEEDGELPAESAALLDEGLGLTQDQRRTVRDRFLILCAITALILMTISPITEYYGTWILQRINQYLRVTMIERAEHLSLRYHNHARTGDAIYRVYQDSATITNVVQGVLVRPAIAVSQVAFSFFVIWMFSPYLGLLFLAGMLPVLWLAAWYTPRLLSRSARARATNSDLTSRIQEALSAIRVVKANRAEKVLMDRFNHDSYAALDASYYLRAEQIAMYMLTMVATGAMITAAQYVMSGWTIAGDNTFAAGAVALVGFAAWNVGAFESARNRMEGIIGNGLGLIGMWGVIQDTVKGLDRAFFLLDLEPDVVDKAGAVPMPAPIREVVYANTAFGYDAGQPVLSGVNLEARPGTITAIVGETGSGKSTLLSLLLRLYDPDSGSISINGTDIRDIRVDDLRAGVAIALQQNVLFAATVADNIAYATQAASRKDIEAAAAVACADGFIREMAQGYDTELGERGGKLSTGQRQRLSIARAVVRDAPVLILDEPTASLDAETEQQVLANLAEWGRERVVFLITHRLSTIRNADQIAFLEDGVTAELGEHETLMAKPEGRYRRFVEAEIIGIDGEEADGVGP